MKYMKPPSPVAILAFFASFLLCAVMAGFSIRHQSQVDRMAMERLVSEKSMQISELITRLLYKTEVLSALVIENDGRIENFERVAAAISDHPAILNLVMAPKGIVSHVYPLKGNRRVLGHNLLGEGEGNREARLARDKDALVFAGPFKLVEGGKAMVGRLPVWRKTADGKKVFWGLVSVALKYPDIFAGSGLDELKKTGFDFEIWRINPDTQKKQVIVRSGRAYDSSTDYMEMPLAFLNAEWVFRILPVRPWYAHAENVMLIFAVFFISTLVGLVVQRNHELRHMHQDLERMIRTDSLTGILNRKGLFERFDALISAKTPFEVCYLDLNYFKAINDIYGHHAGDHALVEFTRKMEKHLGVNDVFGRISGDEFILARTGGTLAPEEEIRFWKTVQADFLSPLFSIGQKEIRLTFSKGVASYPADGTTADELICAADQKMYTAKNERYATEKRRRYSDWAKAKTGT